MTSTGILKNVVGAALAAFVLMAAGRARADAAVSSRDGFTVANLELFPRFVLFTTIDGKPVAIDVDRPVLAYDLIGGPPALFLVERTTFDAWRAAEAHDDADALVRRSVRCDVSGASNAESQGRVQFAGRALGDDSPATGYPPEWERLETYSLVEATSSRCAVVGGLVKPEEARRTPGGCAGCTTAPATGAGATVAGLVGAVAVFGRRRRRSLTTK